MLYNNRVYNERQSISSLRWRWLLITFVYGATLLLGYWVILQEWQAGVAAQWLALASATMAIQMGILWWALGHNRRPSDANLLPFIGYANGMTVTRGLLACLLAGFLFSPRPLGWLAWAPALLYTSERLLDYFDGYVARITRHETRLGVILDMEFDGIGFLVAIVLAIQYGQLPVWYIVLGLARHLFVIGLWLRRWWQLPVHPLPPSDQGRLIAGLQTSFASVVLWPSLSPLVSNVAAYLFAVPLIYSFGRDWLVVSGVVDAESSAYHRTRGLIKQAFEGWLPFVARIIAALWALWFVWQAAATAQSLISYTLVLLGIAAALLLLFGVVGRLMALALVVLACVDIAATGLHWAGNGLWLVCLIAVVQLGSGHLALWKPEERLLRAKLGLSQAQRQQG